MKNTRVARRYAVALMADSVHQKNIEGTAKDMELIGKTLSESRELRLFVASPIVSQAKKRKVFIELWGSSIGKDTQAFIGLLTEKSREAVLLDVTEEFKILHDEFLGIVNVEVKTAVEFTYAQEKELRLQLEQLMNKKVRLHFVNDKTIKAGLVIRIGDTVLDSSVTRQLELMRGRFLAGQAA
jgi:F-type H+-transporting ATPase subunit delta